MPKGPEGSAMRYTIDRASWLVGRAAVEHPMEGDDGDRTDSSPHMASLLGKVFSRHHTLMNFNFHPATGDPH